MVEVRTSLALNSR